MGYNTTIMLMNDSLDAIDKDLERWWKGTYQAIQRRAFSPRDQVGAANHCNVSQVASCEHADFTQIVAVGGNYASLLGIVRGYTHDSQEDKERILRSLASDLGYDLRKKPKR